MVRRRDFIAGLAGAALGTPAAALAQTLEPVSVIVFPGGFNWPIWVAQEKGYFAKGGIEVRLTPTPSSMLQLTGLIEGKFDIAATAIDNVVAYVEGQGEASVSVKPDLFVFMGGDSGLLSLAVLTEIKTYADLKGKTFSVDAMTTGYAFRVCDPVAGLDDQNVTLIGSVPVRRGALEACRPRCPIIRAGKLARPSAISVTPRIPCLAIIRARHADRRGRRRASRDRWEC
jgi:ABC-type nitrate/sulfonate/bicarbonate transport system substrate-binding protein